MTPQGWTETGPQELERGQIRIRLYTAFKVSEGGQSAEVQVSHISHAHGSPPQLLNVNRWREQIGLEPITQEQLDKDPPSSIKAGNLTGQIYDFAGPTGADQKRMLVATLEHGQQTWFFKLLGPAAVVGKNKSPFESFVQSVKFTGAADEQNLR